jgi:hypothetical protein
MTNNMYRILTRKIKVTINIVLILTIIFSSGVIYPNKIVSEAMIVISNDEILSETESNNTGGTANYLNYVTLPASSYQTAPVGAVCKGKIGSNGDVDYYKDYITGYTAQTFRVDLINIPAGKDYDVRIYNNVDSEIACSTSTNATQDYESVVFTITKPSSMPSSTPYYYYIDRKSVV